MIIIQSITLFEIPPIPLNYYQAPSPWCCYNINQGRHSSFFNDSKRFLKSGPEFFRLSDRTIGIQPETFSNFFEIHGRVIDVGADTRSFDRPGAKFGNLNVVIFGIIIGLIVVHND